MGVNVEAVEAAIRARYDSQLAAVGALAGARAEELEAEEALAGARRRYAERWAEAVKAEVPESELRKGGYPAPEVPVASRKRAPRKRVQAAPAPQEV